MYILSMPPLDTDVTFDFAVSVSVSNLPPLKSIISCSSYIEPADTVSRRRPSPSSVSRSPKLSSFLTYIEPCVVSIDDTIPLIVPKYLVTPSLSIKHACLFFTNSPL